MVPHNSFILKVNFDIRALAINVKCVLAGVCIAGDEIDDCGEPFRTCSYRGKETAENDVVALNPMGLLEDVRRPLELLTVTGAMESSAPAAMFPS